MISVDALWNVIAYSAQLGAVVVLAALLGRLIRIDAAGVRYTYWRAVGALCLALPWLQATYRPVAGAGAGSSAAVSAIMTAVAPEAVDPTTDLTWPALIIAVIAAGAIARIAWVVAGLIKLHRVRASAIDAEGQPRTNGPGGPATGPSSVDPRWRTERRDCVTTCGPELQTTLGTRAEIRFVAVLAHPVTFGLRRPVVLLPAHLREQPPAIQRAVLGHELLHVQRRDWAWLVAEEIIRAALWFHPAAWWLISRIQLAREEAVDELAVMLTGQRKVYVEALLAFADSATLVPTTAFARRRHLFRRITLVSKEAVMSSRRIVASSAALALVLATGSWYAVSAFPLRQSGVAVSGSSISPGPLERRAVAITPENPIPRRVSSEPMVYPAEAGALDASGEITLSVTLDELGRVAEVRPTRFQIFSATLGMNGTSVQVGPDTWRPGAAGTPLSATGRGAPMVAVFDAVTRTATDALKQWRYDPPFKAPLSFPVTLRYGAPPPPAPAPPAAAAARSTPGVYSPFAPRETGTATGQISRSDDGALRVGGGIAAPQKIKHVPPIYPDDAQGARVEGVVIIEARIEADGHVGAARILRSIPMLDQAALDAVRQWEFTPTLLNGVPTPVVMAVTINFTLQ